MTTVPSGPISITALEVADSSWRVPSAPAGVASAAAIRAASQGIDFVALTGGLGVGRGTGQPTQPYGATAMPTPEADARGLTVAGRRRYGPCAAPAGAVAGQGARCQQGSREGGMAGARSTPVSAATTASRRSATTCCRGWPAIPDSA